jgi:hypothetical protein
VLRLSGAGVPSGAPIAIRAALNFDNKNVCKFMSALIYKVLEAADKKP